VETDDIGVRSRRRDFRASALLPLRLGIFYREPDKAEDPRDPALGKEYGRLSAREIEDRSVEKGEPP
jgi:hypothetical protein